MYSQRDEEQLIRAALESLGFGGPGRFLDIGAADGVTFSNTRALAERGWRGVLVEPSPSHLLAMARLYGAEPERFTLVHAAVTPDAGPAAALRGFHLTGDLVGTLDPAHAEKWRDAGGYFARVLMPTVGVRDLLPAVAREDDPFRVVSIDTEGSSVEIWEAVAGVCGLAPPGLRPLVYVVEHDGLKDRVREAAARHGYREFGETAENLVLARGVAHAAV